MLRSKETLERVNKVLDSMENLLADIKKNQMIAIGKQDEGINVEKDRVSYKQGLVDGICMTSWVEYGKDYVGEKDKDGNAKLLSGVLDEIGSVYGFDGKEELKRVKTANVDDEEEAIRPGLSKPELIEVTDDDVVDDEELNNFPDSTKDY